MSLLFLFLATTSSAVDCGPKSGGKLCPQGACCAYNGYCGKADIYCDPFLCISQCPISKIISERIYNQIFPNRNDKDCSAKDFYTYRAFIEASKSFPAFGATGNDTVRLREIAAFLGQTSFETRGNDDSKIAADVRYKTGYCKIEIDDKIVWCNWESEWDCVYGRNYYGRGPWGNKFVSNDIYGPCGIALGLDLLMNPGLVSYDPVISFSAALWFWMTPQSNNKPSSHAVMVGEWVPTQADVNAGRLPGYGAITNIINGGLECGGKITWEEAQRLGFYQRICDIIGIPYGNNLNCFGQQPFGQGRIQDFKSGKTIIDKKRTKSIDI